MAFKVPDRGTRTWTIQKGESVLSCRIRSIRKQIAYEQESM